MQAAYAHLLERLSDFHPLSMAFRLALFPLLNRSVRKKGSQLVHCGRRQEVVWFLHRGTAMEISPCDTDVRGRVSWFWYQSDFLFSYPGFFNREPSIASMELVEDSILLEIGYDDFMSLRMGFSEVHLLVERIRAYNERLRVMHANDLVNLSAKQRYDKFFAMHKNLFNIAKHRDIASFLGIKDDGFHRYH